MPTLKANLRVIKAAKPVGGKRTRYRIDVLQPIYYQLNSVNDLYDLANTDIMAEVAKATPNVDVREAALLSAIAYMCDYFVAQIQASGK